MQKERQYFIDWIRVLAFGILIFYHSGMFFVPWGWHVKNNVIVENLTYPMLFFNQWRLSLLFFISGVGISFAFKSRSGWGFAGERTRRLFIPIVFGMLVIVPPQIYFERTQAHQIAESYAQFYPSIFEFIPYPKGNLSWNHLWFVVYLWVFSLVGIPVFLGLHSQVGQRMLDKFYQFILHPISIYLLLIPFMSLFWLWDKTSPTTHNLIHDKLNLINSFLLVIMGFVLGQSKRFWEMTEQFRKEFLWAAIVFGILFFWIVEIGIGLTDDQYFIAKGIITRINAFSDMLCICGFAKHYLNFTNKGLQYANEAVLPFYILHQTITVAIGFYIADLDWAWQIKLLILMAGTFFGAWGIYQFLIRPFDFMRLLFGVKSRGNFK
jgi:glucans biosynthesis protein C